MVVNNGLISKFTPEPIDISEYKDTSNVRIAKAKYELCRIKTFYET